nr:ABC transporter permease subunit [Halarchaeum acidiphilum]
MTAVALPLATTDWAFVRANLPTLLGGVVPALQLTVYALVVGFVAGLPLGALEVYGGRRSAWLARKAGVAVRGTPILVLMFIAYFGLGLSPSVVAATTALGVRSAAYQGRSSGGRSDRSIGGRWRPRARSVSRSAAPFGT